MPPVQRALKPEEPRKSLRSCRDAKFRAEAQTQPPELARALRRANAPSTWRLFGNVCFQNNFRFGHKIPPLPATKISVSACRPASSPARSFRRFGRAMSLVAIPGQLAPILGPVLGGAIATGAILAPQGLGTMIAIALAGRWSDRAGPRPVVIAGMSATALATLALVHPVVASERALLALALFARGAGLGAAGIPIMAAAYHGLETREYARATAGVNVMQRLGASFGTALLAVALQRGLASTNTGPGAGYAAAAAFRGPFLWAVAFAALALLPALTLPRRQQVKEEREVDRDASRDL